MNTESLMWIALPFLVGTSILAAFGVDHASESLLIAVISPLILVSSITVGVTLCVFKVVDLLSKRKERGYNW